MNKRNFANNIELDRNSHIQGSVDTQASSIFIQSVKQAFIKLSPRTMIKNPIMFVVEIGFIITLFLAVIPDLFGESTVSTGFNVAVSLVLFFTIVFANFAEALAEGRGKAQANSLKQSKGDITANQLQNGQMIQVSASQLKKEISSSFHKAK